jgi:hypothetical protein
VGGWLLVRVPESVIVLDLLVGSQAFDEIALWEESHGAYKNVKGMDAVAPYARKARWWW